MGTGGRGIPWDLPAGLAASRNYALIALCFWNIVFGGMAFPFLDRTAELARLDRALSRREGTLSVVFGRRRVGKSRLVREALIGRPAAYYVADDRDAAVQRSALAIEISRLLPGFAEVTYGSWETLLGRFAREAPAGAVLALDELPSIVARSPELPSLLQKFVDEDHRPARHLVLLGSSQRMMHGLALDSTAPLFGRAREILRVGPLGVGWLRRGMGVKTAGEVVARWAAFGGVPRYWELARPFRTARLALRDLALDPLGVLHQEPDRLLRDDLDDVARAASVLGLVAGGAHRASEIAGRLGSPVTSLSRPLARLVELGLVQRDVPFGESHRDSKRSLYRVADPFLRTWYRFVDPNRSRLEARDIDAVEHDIDAKWSSHLGEAWEDLARSTLPALRIHGRQWNAGQRFWGKAISGQQIELDIVAETAGDPTLVLVGEVKHRLRSSELDRALHDLHSRAAACPALSGRRIQLAIWVLEGTFARRPEIVGANAWLRAVERAR
jgi:AAA+ ATPase superfamily predicted ATPase